MVERRKNRGFYRWTGLLLAFLSLLLAGLAWQARQQENRQNHIYTQLDLAMISDSLKALSADSPAAISLGTLTNLNARVLYGMLSATNAGAVFLEHRREWDRRQELLDPWGRPFQVQLMGAGPAFPPTGEARVKIWSVGPNGRDEGGAGDDITCQTVAIRLGH